MSKKNETGLRFTTQAKNREAVACFYRQAGFEPLRIEEENDGCITFVFAKMSDTDMKSLVYAVPVSFSAIKGFVANNSRQS